MNLLPNLQLLAGTANIEKQDGLPAEWIDTAFPSEDKRATYLAEHDLDGLPLDLAHFTAFFRQRKQRIRTRLLAMLGAAPARCLRHRIATDVGSGMRYASRITPRRPQGLAGIFLTRRRDG